MKTITSLKPKLVSAKEIADLKTKFWKLKTTVSTYTTKYGTLCTLYTFWQWKEKAGQMHDYGYWKVFKDFVHKLYYTDNENWLDN